ncbi:histone-lysine n-methyltransferase setmar-like protein [Trichonephila clavipes]|nr:histone-lysine n-methyltransferase setmar-like protein [Trichonephila clavipes]
MLQKAFKDECMGKTQIKEWYGRFKNGRTSVDSDPCSGRPSTGTSSHNVERVRVTVEQHRRLTIITGDETWVYGYDPETKQQSSQWKFPSEPRPKKARQSRSNIKSMLIVFFYYEGIVHHEYAHTGQIIKKEYYIEVLKRLRNFGNPVTGFFITTMLQRAHTLNFVQQYLSKHSIVQLRQPPYSPDIAPCDFWLFPRLKMPLKGHRFDNKQTVETNATNALKAISKTDFQECFNKWKHRYEQLVQSNGDYFEGCPRMTKNKLSAEKPK